MHVLCFIIDLGTDGCIHAPCVSNELRPIFKSALICIEFQCKIDAPVGGEHFSTVAPRVIYEQT